MVLFELCFGPASKFGLELVLGVRRYEAGQTRHYRAARARQPDTVCRSENSDGSSIAEILHPEAFTDSPATESCGEVSAVARRKTEGWLPHQVAVGSG